jgi:hypothetical protein
MSFVNKSKGDSEIIALGTATTSNDANGTITLRSAEVVIIGNLQVNGSIDFPPDFQQKLITINDILSPTDVNADGGGLKLKATSDKTLTWVDATKSWTSNVNFDLSDVTSVFSIGGSTVLTATQLGFGVAVDGGTY